MTPEDIAWTRFWFVFWVFLVAVVLVVKSVWQ